MERVNACFWPCYDQDCPHKCCLFDPIGLDQVGEVHPWDTVEYQMLMERKG